MDITASEMQMYMVMKSLYDSGIPICFKGSMVLKALLNEAGFTDNVRRTVDIDANWNFDEPPTSEQLIASLQSALDHNKLQIDVKLVRMYGDERSAGFILTDRKTKSELFSMDIDINRPMPETRLYEIAGMRFYGVSPTQIIADKICVVSSNRVYSRIKDVIDLYYISKVFSYSKEEVILTLLNSGRSLDHFNGFLNHIDELRHAYNKFRVGDNVEKPSFEEVYLVVKEYVYVFLPYERERVYER